MIEKEDQLNEKESLHLITQMINKARSSYYGTGIDAIMWGSVIATCSLVRLSEIHFGYRLPFDVYLLTIVAVIPQIIITIREKRKQIVKPYDEAFMGNLWLAFGICIFLMIFIINSVFRQWSPVAGEFRELTGHAPGFQFSEFIAPFFLLLYGFPTFVTGAACRFKPMLFGGLLCWACSLVTIFTPIKVDHSLTALSAVMAWLIPGLILYRNYRSAKMKTLNV